MRADLKQKKMNGLKTYSLLVLVALTTLGTLCAQESPKVLPEEESAEVFLEEYTDDFQETFFEALKQKGIQNYDRAINLLLSCKQMDPTVIAVDHELAKTYFLDGRYFTAQRYAIECVVAEASNYWFLDTLIKVLDKQDTSIQSLSDTLPYTDEKLQANLALIYFKNAQHEAALKVLEHQKSDLARELTLKINDTLRSKKSAITVNTSATTKPPTSDAKNPTDAVRDRMMELLEAEDFKALEDVAVDAVETFPLQPEFYYFYGAALNKNGKPNEALEVLQTGLDYLFEPGITMNKIYQEMAAAHTALGNTSKANEYLSKVKSGL